VFHQLLATDDRALAEAIRYLRDLFGCGYAALGVGVGSRSGAGSGARSGPLERAWFGGEHADKIRILLILILLFIILILILIPSSIQALPWDAQATGNPSIEI
jgi:hypothetical protein